MNKVTLDRWEPTGDFDGGDPRSRLTAERACIINGAGFHVEAWEVAEDAEGLLQAVNPGLREDFDVLCEMIWLGCPETIEIEGRTYVIITIPFNN